jgi:hypothetical protein
MASRLATSSGVRFAFSCLSAANGDTEVPHVSGTPLGGWMLRIPQKVRENAVLLLRNLQCLPLPPVSI